MESLYLRVKGWNEFFESAKSRTFVTKRQAYMPNKHGLGYRRLISMPDGEAMFGAWCALIQVLSRQKSPRQGYLTDTGRIPGGYYTDTAVSLLTGYSEQTILKMYAACLDPQIQWLEVVTDQGYHKDTTGIPQGYHKDTTGIPQYPLPSHSPLPSPSPSPLPLTSSGEVSPEPPLYFFQNNSKTTQRFSQRSEEAPIVNQPCSEIAKDEENAKTKTRTDSRTRIKPIKTLDCCENSGDMLSGDVAGEDRSSTVPKNAKTKSCGKSAPGDGKERPRNSYADEFKTAFDKAFPSVGGYAFKKADFVMLAGWRKDHPDVGPVAFVRAAWNQWQRGEYCPKSAKTIKGLCGAWDELASFMPANDEQSPDDQEYDSRDKSDWHDACFGQDVENGIEQF